MLNLEKHSSAQAQHSSVSSVYIYIFYPLIQRLIAQNNESFNGKIQSKHYERGRGEREQKITLIAE